MPPSVGPPQPGTLTPVEAAMRTLQAVICSGTPVAAKRRKKNKTGAAIAVDAVAQAAGAVRRDGSVEREESEEEEDEEEEEGEEVRCRRVGFGVPARGRGSCRGQGGGAAKVAAVEDAGPPGMIFGLA